MKRSRIRARVVAAIAWASFAIGACGADGDEQHESESQYAVQFVHQASQNAIEIGVYDPVRQRFTSVPFEGATELAELQMSTEYESVVIPGHGGFESDIFLPLETDVPALGSAVSDQGEASSLLSGVVRVSGKSGTQRISSGVSTKGCFPKRICDCVCSNYSRPWTNKHGQTIHSIRGYTTVEQCTRLVRKVYNSLFRCRPGWGCEPC